MTRPRSSFTCSGCSAQYGRWQGKCTQCGEFGTIGPATQVSSVGLRGSGVVTVPRRPAVAVPDVDVTGPLERLGTGLGEFDRVLGGGFVPGQVLLLFGEPGAGKSTLLLTAAHNVAVATGRTVLYLSGEESTQQLAVRARRIGATSSTLLLADSNDLAEVTGHIEAQGEGLALAIVDSVQSIASAEVEGRAGGVAQVMEVASTLTRLAKERGLPVCLVGQVTKESTVAGPRALEHVCDTSLSIEGDRQTPLRLLRTVKNRFGPADEVACFEQTDTGMVEVADPSGLFRSIRSTPIAGTCITVTVEGRRPLLVEVQALVSATQATTPRRGVSGLDTARVAMLVAVTQRATRVALHDKDVYAATVGGMRSHDPGSDLAVCLALASAATGRALPLDVAAIGEVSLSGDIRRVTMLGQRIAEAARLGHGRILVPAGTRDTLAVRTGTERLIEVPALGPAFEAATGQR